MGVGGEGKDDEEEGPWAAPACSYRAKPGPRSHRLPFEDPPLRSWKEAVV